METPKYDHLTLSDFDHVYEPAEDTFLLLDALESDLKNIDEKQPLICLEVGVGSGVIITALAKRIKSAIFFGTDINPHACVATKETAIHNRALLTDVINCNITDAFRSRSIDLLIFNPPYVVTPKEDSGLKSTDRNLVLSWAGGENGRYIIDKLLINLNNILTKSGVLYLLLLQENKPKDIVKILKTLGFSSNIILKRHIPGELLYVLKAFREEI